VAACRAAAAAWAEGGSEVGACKVEAVGVCKAEVEAVGAEGVAVDRKTQGPMRHRIRRIGMGYLVVPVDRKES